MSRNDDSRIARLLQQARDGDTNARDRLFEACRSYLGVVARAQVESWLRAKVDASDIVQQTMLEAHQGFDQFRGGTQAEWLAWLRRILSHNAADFVRQYRGTEKRQARREVPLDLRSRDGEGRGVPEPAGDVETPSQLVLRKERQLELADAITRLDPDHREVIMLRNLERLRFDEVAQQMNRSRPAVQMLWMRAIRKLEEVMNDE